ncbi:MAG TPA: flagellar biosynthesis protein FlgB [Caulobacteraceae bacterium]|nr:flagellar biosynthesis protein FlgB [Caulobacteraceae bacterium]
MDIQSIPLFSMLRSRIGYLNQRQQLIAQNVANASTPGFTPRDLKPFKVDAGMGGSAGSTLALAQVAQGASASSAGMISLSGGLSAGPAGETKYGSVAAPDDETKIDGNQVALEDQMLKMNETRADYEAAVGLYEKAMSFLQMAAKVPGK